MSWSHFEKVTYRKTLVNKVKMFETINFTYIIKLNRGKIYVWTSILNSLTELFIAELIPVGQWHGFCLDRPYRTLK